MVTLFVIWMSLFTLCHNLYLIEFTNERAKEDRVRKLRVEKETDKVEWIIETTDCLEDASNGVDLPLVDVVLTIKLE